jgi:hypothetical protein
MQASFRNDWSKNSLLESSVLAGFHERADPVELNDKGLTFLE